MFYKGHYGQRQFADGKMKKICVMFVAELGNSTQILRKHFLNFWLLNNVKFIAITHI